jgi:hypothetical protein
MGVPLDIIKKMGAEQTDSSICLAEVLEWIRDESSVPTRKKFNDIKQKIEEKAKKTH